MHHVRIARQLTDDRLTELLDEHGSVSVQLEDFAAAPDPSRTDPENPGSWRKLYGPAEIEYVRYQDGGITATILA
jgi:hypothetical protein